MHHRIRPLLGHIPFTLYGAGVGIGSAVLWLRVLTPGRPFWVSGAAAGACSLLVVSLTALGQRARRPQVRRRAHARPRPTTRKAA